MKWLCEMARENIPSIAPRVVDEFVRYGDQIHKTLTWKGKCQSWYKANRVDGSAAATFAGSTICTISWSRRFGRRTLRFGIGVRIGGGLGSGFIEFEVTEGSDLSFYVEH